MSAAHPEEPRNPTPKKRAWGALIAANLLAFVLTKACQPEPKRSTEEIASSMATATAETQSATRRSALSTPVESSQERDAMPWLKSQFGSDPSEVLVQNPALWYGYVASAYVEGSRLHVQLQVDRKQDKELGEQAAKALASFVMFSDDPLVSGVEYALAEDGTGVVIDQERVKGR